MNKNIIILINTIKFYIFNDITNKVKIELHLKTINKIKNMKQSSKQLSFFLISFLLKEQARLKSDLYLPFSV